METQNVVITVPVGYLLTARVNDKPYTVDPTALSNEALLHVIEYGYQRIVNDKTGGKNRTDADKDGLAKAMVARLLASPYVRRKGGRGSAEPIVAFIRRVMRDLLAVPTNAARKTEYAGLAKDQDTRGDYLDAWFDELPEAVAAKVTLAAEKAMADDVAKKAAFKKGIAELNADMAELAKEAGSELIRPEDVPTPAKKAAKKK